jgi:hypothetical protein
VSASEVIARLRELRAKATKSEWLAIKSPRYNHWKIGDGRSVYFDVCNFINIEHFAKWGTSGTAEDNAKYTAAAMNSLESLLACAEALAEIATWDATTDSWYRHHQMVQAKARSALQALGKTTGETNA